MDNSLKCFDLLSLKELCLRRVVVFLWSDSDILASISKFSYNGFSTQKRENHWKETIEVKITDRISRLSEELPNQLLPQMKNIVKHMSIDIRNWKAIHQDSRSFAKIHIGLPDSAKLCWTSEGALDYRETAKNLVRCDKLNVVQRYTLASHYCLEDDIPSIWNDFPEDKRSLYGCLNQTSSLSFYWLYLLEGRLSQLDHLWKGSASNLTSYNQWAFENSARTCNKSATEYFYQKLTNEERQASLMRTVEYLLPRISLGFLCENFTDVMFYLLSLLRPEQQIVVVTERPIQVFLCFIHWRRQRLFLENASLIWTFLPQRDYGRLLLTMRRRLRVVDVYCPKLFLEFLKRSPPDFKRFIVNEDVIQSINAGEFVCRYFDFEDPESVVEIFSRLDAADRVKLVLNAAVFEFLFDNIWKDEWREVKFFLVNAKLAKEDKKKVNERFKCLLRRKDWRYEEEKCKRLIVSR